MRILHGADLHLDSPFSQLGAEKARQRRQESRELPEALAALAHRENVDLVLLAGDLFDGAQVYPETIEALIDALGRMKCPVFIAPGNHDPYTARSPYAAAVWPENVHIFREETLAAVEVPELSCVVHGAAFTDEHRTSEVLADFTAPEDGKSHLLCIHGAVNEPGSGYGPVRTEQIAASRCRYAALGHIHQYSGLQRAGQTAWAYCGCAEGRGFDELDDKGVVIADMGEERTDLRFVPLGKRHYRVLTVDVTGQNAGEALEAAMPETASDDTVRVVFTGETEERGIDLVAIDAAYASHFYALQLRDETIIARDIWLRAGEDNLRGAFLKELRARYDSAVSEEEKETIIAAVRFGLAAMDGRDLG